MDDVADIETVVRALPADRKRELRLWLRLLSCTNLITTTIRRNLRATYGLTLPQFDLMAQLQKEPDGLRLSELSQRLMVSNGNLTGLVERLVVDGLVTREVAASDRRAAIVRLTSKGAGHFAKVAKTHEKWVRDLFAGIDDARMTALTRDLGVLKASARRIAPSP